MLGPVDLHKDLIKMPLPLCMLTQIGQSFRTDLLRKDETKPVDPEPDAFVADVYSALVKRSSTFRNESGNRTYIITANWITSRDVLK